MAVSKKTPAGAPIYPPRWYLDLVRARLRAVETDRATAHDPDLGAAGDGASDTELLALAQEIVALDGLDALPPGLKQYALGLELAEVRAYLREAAGELAPDRAARPGAAPRARALTC